MEHIFVVYMDLADATGIPKVMKRFSCLAQLRLIFNQLINVKMSTIIGILTFISRINHRLWSSKPSISTYLAILEFLSNSNFMVS